MFEKAPNTLNFLDREKQVREYWKVNDIFKKSIDNREGGENFTFYDGPPTANGRPHIGHVLTRSVKDCIPRYQTMKGKHVLRKAGWDTHGLPVELEVEKMLGLDGKEQVEQYGVEPFNKACKESVWKYSNEWREMSDAVAYWADMENPYITYDNNYIESVWWSLKQVFDKGLLYKGYKIVPYCPRCGTALSSHEVAQGYKSVTERSAVVRFRAKGEENTWFYAWTTTPWTLPSNGALCVNPDETYAKFDWDGRTIIMGEALIDTLLGEGVSGKVENKTTMPGRDLVGMEYEPLFPFVKEIVPDGKWRVVADGYVTMTDGTGIVHIASAFGEDDARVGRENDIPFLQLVDAAGRMDKRTPWAGVFVKKADPLILEELEKNGNLVKAPEFTHDYPFCWRCDTPLIYYARASWFIKMTAVKEQLIANNRSVNWIPETIKEGRMGNWLENVIDWGVSRERYWGTPLPVWICQDCGKLHCVGSIAELRELGEDVPEDIELHKPYIDNVHLKCPHCGGAMKRTPETVDCWYDSGSMPFAQWHYPFENEAIFKANFPADFISEAIDQTRGWFYTLEAISTLVFGCAPFKNVIVLGLVCDENGQKMSKHKGNVVSPWDVLSVTGADAVRWYFYTFGPLWQPSRFSLDLVKENQRKFMGTLWNTYAFFTLYASIDNYDPAKKARPEDFSLMDKWALSKLQTLTKTVDEGLAEYRITDSARAIAAFVDELSNWYVRRCRERFWGKGMESDKLAAFETLYTVLVTLAKLIAPFTPYLAETMYLNLVKNNVPGAPISVHLCDFPTADMSLVDAQLEEEMENVIAYKQLALACRAEANMKVRQPAARLYIRGEKLSEGTAALIADEVNVKEIRFVDDARAFTTYRIKPQLRTLGKKYGKLLKGIGAYLAEADGNEVVDTFDRGEKLRFEVDGQTVELERDDTLIEPMQKEGFVAESDRGVTVVLDTALTPELIEEGFVREMISKLQTMRKEAGFEVTDRIHVAYTAGDKLAGIVGRGCETIAATVLALSIDRGAVAPETAYTKDWSINGEDATISVWKDA